MTTVPAISEFYALEPSIILDAIESLGLKCSGRCLQLNSLENRVYEVELEAQQLLSDKQLSGERFVVVKFYRPGRWTFEQILAEHIFLRELDDDSIGVVPALEFNQNSLFVCPKTAINFAVFPKFSGRNADEFNDQDIQIIGRSLARIHMVGARQKASSRISLDLPDRFDEYLGYLSHNTVIPVNFSERIVNIVLQIKQLADVFSRNVKFIRIHADAHKGNLIKRHENFYWVDFDDFCNGPAVQDLWLLFSGRDTESRKQLTQAIDAYSSLSHFDHNTLFMIEPLRTLRVLYFNVWIHRRWSDQYFKKTFENFGSEHYWQEQVVFFSEQLAVFQEILAAGEPLLAFDNVDYR